MKTAEHADFDRELGRRLERTRRALRMSGRELAREAGISPAALYWYESGEVSCPAALLPRLAAALGVAPAALLPGCASGREPRRRSEGGAPRGAAEEASGAANGGQR